MSGGREEAIRRLLPLVRTVARRIARLVPGSDLDDLIGDGCIGIIRAVDAYDPALGPSLEHYARRIALGAMLNGVRRLDPVSERVRRVVRVAERERYALAVELGAMPERGEIERRHPQFARALTDVYRGAPETPACRHRSALLRRTPLARGQRRSVRVAAAGLAAAPSRDRTHAPHAGPRVNDTPAYLSPADPSAGGYPLAVMPALAPVDAEAAGVAPALPADHPAWQRDVISLSSRARAVVARAVPVVVRTLAYWDHRLREIAFGARTLSVDPAGCYRLR